MEDDNSKVSRSSRIGVLTMMTLITFPAGFPVIVTSTSLFALIMVRLLRKCREESSSECEFLFFIFHENFYFSFYIKNMFIYEKFL